MSKANLNGVLILGMHCMNVFCCTGSYVTYQPPVGVSLSVCVSGVQY